MPWALYVIPVCLMPLKRQLLPTQGKGGKNRRRGKNDSESKRELTFKEDGQEYAQVTRMLGNGRLEAFCFDGVNRLCHIRGKLRKRVWIGVGDIVLLGLREFQDQKADIILKYDGDEARSLKSYNELPETGASRFDRWLATCHPLPPCSRTRTHLSPRCTPGRAVACACCTRAGDLRLANRVHVSANQCRRGGLGGRGVWRRQLRLRRGRRGLNSGRRGLVSRRNLESPQGRCLSVCSHFAVGKAPGI